MWDALRLRATMIRPFGTWMIAAVIVTVALAAAAPSQPTTAPVPSGVEVRRLAMRSLLAFNDALQARDFTAFHASVSSAFRQQVPPAKMLEAFTPFIQRGVQLAVISKVEPVFDPQPGFVEGGRVLMLQGEYPTPRLHVAFNLKYVVEAGEWKLLGINLDIVPVEKLAAPNAEETQRLVKKTLLAFNDAVKSRDFTQFHASAASPLRQQTTPQTLRDAFREFIDQQTDLSPIRELDPHLSDGTAVGDDGVLTVSGEFATQPIRTAFRLRFYDDGGAWKVLGISVDTTPPESGR